MIFKFKTPIVDESELVKFIQEQIIANDKQEIPKEVIELILDYEMKYLKLNGIAK